MPVIAAGGQAVVSIPVGQRITISAGGMGRASFASGGGDAVEQGVLKQFGPAQQYFGPYSAAETALLYADQAVTYSVEDASTGVLTSAQVAALQLLLAGTRVQDAVSRAITALDNGRLLAPTTVITYTIPAGLSPMPSFTVDCPAAGAVTVAVSGGATINGAATALSRTRAANPVGFVVLVHESDAYGVSGS